jgi:homoserine kinase type II
MAVFTALNESDVRSFLAAYPVGELRRFEGIAAGIENSNFFVDTGAGRFVLTVFERLSAHHLPAYLALMRHLATRGVPCPDPVSNHSGALHGTLRGKPCALVTRLSGRDVAHPGLEHCAQVGALLATMHVAARDFTGMPANPRGRSWWAQTAPVVRDFLDVAQRALLDTEMAEQHHFSESADFRALPQGPVHADLFRDNVLFEAHAPGAPVRLAGVIDFYFAGHDSWLYDLAVTVNDWCIDPTSGEFAADRLGVLLAAYRQHRELTAPEIRAWPAMLRAAALRFWLSRLHDLHCPRPAEVIKPKDPAHFERIVRARRRSVPALDRS